MKEIKAYIRPDVLGNAIDLLEKAGASDITVIRVDALGGIADSEADELRFVRKYDKRYSAVAKLEVVCRDLDALPFMNAIRDAAGAGGKGRIFLSNIEHAINIGTGEEGDEAL